MIATQLKTLSDVREVEDFDLSPDDEGEFERRLADSLEAERNGALLPWEALFPRPRLTG
jgi:hypothetical protein